MSHNLTLYDAAAQLETVREWMHEFEEQIIAGDGVIPPELDELLGKAEGDLTVKVERVALVHQEFKQSAEAARSEGQRLLALAGARTRVADSLKHYLLNTLVALRIKKVDAPRIKVAVQRNGQPSIQTPDMTELARMVLENEASRIKHAVPVISADDSETAVERYVAHKYELVAQVRRDVVMADFTAAYDAMAATLPRDMDEFEKHALCMDAGNRALPSWIRVERGYHARFR